MEKKTISLKKKVFGSQVTQEVKKANAPKETAVPSIGLNNLKTPKGAHKGKRVLGRGSSSGHGKTSTRGSKGQTSRAGRDTYLGFEGGQSPLIRRFPKRGFVSQFKKYFQVVNLENLKKIKAAVITPELLEKNGLIRDKNKLIKVLGAGEITQALTIQAHAFSVKAQEKIKNAGGKFEVLNV
jgi:large subunit ribosomal protein L15